MTSQKTRLTVAILLFFTLAAGASALPQAVWAPRHEGFLEILWNELLSLIGRPEAPPASPGQPASQQKEGPQMDPNGGNG